MIIDVHAAATGLTRLIDQACGGEEVIITVDSRPAVKVVPIGRPLGRRVFGSMRGRFTLTDAFFEPLPDDEPSAWEQV